MLPPPPPPRANLKTTAAWAEGDHYIAGASRAPNRSRSRGQNRGELAGIIITMAVLFFFFFVVMIIISIGNLVFHVEREEMRRTAGHQFRLWGECDNFRGRAALLLPPGCVVTRRTESTS